MPSVSPAKMRLRLFRAGYHVDPNPESTGPLPDWLEAVCADSDPNVPGKVDMFRKKGSALNLVVAEGQPLQLIGCCDLFELADLTEGCGDDWKILVRSNEG